MFKFPQNNVQYYQKILENLQKLSVSGELRPQALEIFALVESVQLFFYSKFEAHPDFIPFFEKHFAPFEEFIDEDAIVQICTQNDYLFPESKLFPFTDREGQDVGIAVLESYKWEMLQWWETTWKRHEDSQEGILKATSLEEFPGKAKCACQSCIGDYRNRFRELNYSYCLQLVDKQEEEIATILDAHQDSDKMLQLNELSEQFYHLQKLMDQHFYKLRLKMRRGSLTKLENQVRAYIKSKFSPNSIVGEKYITRLKKLFLHYLAAENFQITLVNDNEMDRFFHQLGPNIWRNETYLEKEFKKLIQSILSLKTQNISSNILQEYLGQFWAHSEARKIKRHIIYHMGPTNSGKTYHAISELCKAKTGCYLAPLRLLAGELYDTMTEAKVPTTLLTGEEVLEHPHATHYSSTIEMAKLSQEFECAVIDEIQMISDPQRGWAWTRALVGLIAQTVHICGDGSVLDLVKNIVEKTGDTLSVREYERLTELRCLEHPITLTSMRKSDALIVFSRRNALKFKADLEKLGFKVSIIYGRLGPEVRREQARKFDVGETDIIVSTDAIAMGMNLPIKRIVFSTLTKFIDNKEKKISDSEIKQIAGRAGRYKRFPIGEVTCLNKVSNGPELIQKSFYAPIIQSNKAMVGPDLEIFEQVNAALKENTLPGLDLSEFLRLFNTMDFRPPFYCVDLTEMIELAEMVEKANEKYNALTTQEIFGFACAPVNMGIIDHVQYYIHILNNYIKAMPISNEQINFESDNIDYLETSIKCVELYQWLARHFHAKHFAFDEHALLHNKSLAIERLNTLLSDKIIPNCNSCGVQLPQDCEYTLCQDCFLTGKFRNKNKQLRNLKSSPDKNRKHAPSRRRPASKNRKYKK